MAAEDLMQSYLPSILDSVKLKQIHSNRANNRKYILLSLRSFHSKPKKIIVYVNALEKDVRSQ